MYKLVYDSATNSFHDNPKVNVKVPGFGDTSSVEYLNPGLIDTFEYFHDMVEYFVDSALGQKSTFLSKICLENIKFRQNLNFLSLYHSHL